MITANLTAWLLHILRYVELVQSSPSDVLLAITSICNPDQWRKENESNVQSNCGPLRRAPEPVEPCPDMPVSEKDPQTLDLGGGTGQQHPLDMHPLGEVVNTAETYIQEIYSVPYEEDTNAKEENSDHSPCNFM